MEISMNTWIKAEDQKPLNGQMCLCKTESGQVAVLEFEETEDMLACWVWPSFTDLEPCDFQSFYIVQWKPIDPEIV
jgi:hypothetical protein